MTRPSISTMFAPAILGPALCLACVVAIALAAPDIRIAREVYGGGGGTLGQPPVRVTGTVGQPAVGILDASGVVLRSGFWQPSGPVSAVPGETAPDRPALLGNTPNPFNPATEISFSVGPAARPTRLQVFDLGGRLVRTLVDGVVSPGVTRIMWRGDDDRGSQVASGVYFYRLQVGGEQFTQKMMLLK